MGIHQREKKKTKAEVYKGGIKDKKESNVRVSAAQTKNESSEKNVSDAVEETNNTEDTQSSDDTVTDDTVTDANISIIQTEQNENDEKEGSSQKDQQNLKDKAGRHENELSNKIVPVSQNEVTEKLEKEIKLTIEKEEANLKGKLGIPDGETEQTYNNGSVNTERKVSDALKEPKTAENSGGCSENTETDVNFTCVQKELNKKNKTLDAPQNTNKQQKNIEETGGSQGNKASDEKIPKNKTTTDQNETKENEDKDNKI